MHNRKATLGIGGFAEGYEEFALVVLKDEEQQRTFEIRIQVFIPDDNPAMMEIDGSILGRDVLDRVRMLYDGPGGIIELDVLQPDFTHKA